MLMLGLSLLNSNGLNKKLKQALINLSGILYWTLMQMPSRYQPLLYIEDSMIPRAAHNSGYFVMWSARSHNSHSVNDKQWLDLLNVSSEKLVDL